MASRKWLFRIFLRSVMEEMEAKKKTKKFEWAKMAVFGARNVAKELEEKHHFVVELVTKGDEEVAVVGENFKHRFLIEKDQFQYLKENGKVKQIFKEFEALKSEFWAQDTKRDTKRRERQAVKARKSREDEIFDAYRSQSKVERGKGLIKLKRKVKKEARRAKQGKSGEKKKKN